MSLACPNCGGGYDPEKDTVVDCPVCGRAGSTACCNPGGGGAPCLACEEAEN